jgi:hypothetical protein
MSWRVNEPHALRTIAIARCPRGRCVLSDEFVRRCAELPVHQAGLATKKLQKGCLRSEPPGPHSAIAARNHFDAFHSFIRNRLPRPVFQHGSSFVTQSALISIYVPPLLNWLTPAEIRTAGGKYVCPKHGLQRNLSNLVARYRQRPRQRSRRFNRIDMFRCDICNESRIYPVLVFGSSK